MPEPEWMNLVKCGFGALERQSLLQCSSCSLKYFDYCELSVTCDCCSRSAGNSHRGLTASPWISTAIYLLRLVLPDAVDSQCGEIFYNQKMQYFIRMILKAWVYVFSLYMICNISYILFTLSVSRDIWSAVGGHGPV